MTKQNSTTVSVLDKQLSSSSSSTMESFMNSLLEQQKQNNDSGVVSFVVVNDNACNHTITPTSKHPYYVPPITPRMKRKQASLRRWEMDTSERKNSSNTTTATAAPPNLPKRRISLEEEEEEDGISRISLSCPAHVSDERVIIRSRGRRNLSIRENTNIHSKSLVKVQQHQQKVRYT